MKTKLLLLTILTLLSISHINARILDIAITYTGYGAQFQPNLTGIQFEIELGDTIDFYGIKCSPYVFDDFSSSVIINGTSVAFVNSVSWNEVLVYRYIPVSVGLNSFTLSYSASNGPVYMNGDINVVTPTINLNPNLLEAQYDLDVNANDLSGNNHDGFLFGPVGATDRFGNPSSALSFQIGDYVDINDGVFFQNDPFAISFWFKLDQVNASGTMINLSDELKIGFNGNNLLEVTVGSTGYQGITAPFNTFVGFNSLIANVNPVNLNTWHNVIVSCKRMIVSTPGVSPTASLSFNGGNYFEVFLDGQKVYSSLPNRPEYQTNGGWFTKADDFKNTLSPIFGTDFIGYLDDVSIWNTEINELEASSIYNSTSVGIDEKSSSNDNLYPNPTTDFVNISGTDNIETVKVFDMNGRLVLLDNTSKVDVSTLENGVYTVFVNDIIRTKLIKE